MSHSRGNRGKSINVDPEEDIDSTSPQNVQVPSSSSRRKASVSRGPYGGRREAANLLGEQYARQLQEDEDKAGQYDSDQQKKDLFSVTTPFHDEEINPL